MKQIKINETFQIEISREELEYIRDMTQNGLRGVSREQERIRTSLFISAMQILGYDIDENGQIKR